MKYQTTRQKQAEETKQRITACALELFNKKDIESVAITEICKKAGVSNGHFYNYFRTKEEILLSEYPAFDEYVKDKFSKLHFDSALDAVRELIYRQVAGANDIGPNLFSQILRIQLRQHGKYVLENERYFHKYLRRLIQAAIQQRELDEKYDANDIVAMILRMSRGLLFDWSMRGGDYQIELQTVKDLNILLRSFQPVN